MTASAQFVFDGQPTIALPKMLDMLRSDLRAGDTQVAEASLTSLRLQGDGLSLNVAIAFRGTEAIVTIALDLEDADAEQARLASLAYTFAKHSAPVQIVWADTDLRIPTATFLAGLKATFEPDASPAPKAPAAIAPRRVAKPARISMRPAARSLRLSDPRFDAHVAAYEAHLRTDLMRDATDEELDILRADGETLATKVGNAASNATFVMQSAELRAASLVTTVTTLMLSSSAYNII